MIKTLLGQVKEFKLVSLLTPLGMLAEVIVENRGYSVEKSEEIISNQPSDEEYNHFADEFIDNTFSVEKTREQIDMILSNKEC